MNLKNKIQYKNFCFCLITISTIFLISNPKNILAQTTSDYLEIGQIYFKKPLVENQANRVYTVVKNSSPSKDFSGLIKITFKDNNNITLDTHTQCLSVIANSSDTVFTDITPPVENGNLNTIVEILPNTNIPPIEKQTDTQLVDKDNDGDGTGNLIDTDDDNDDLADNAEIIHKTDPLNPDTDRDSIKDGKEVQVGTSPTNSDTDGDKTADNLDYYPIDPLFASPAKSININNQNNFAFQINSQIGNSLSTNNSATNQNIPIFGSVLGLFSFKLPNNNSSESKVSGIFSSANKNINSNEIKINLDSDLDGITNNLEKKLGLNPNNPNTFKNIPDLAIYNFIWIIKYIILCIVFYWLGKKNRKSL